MTVVAFEIGFESTSFSAGRIVRNSSGAYAVQYHITDHLGSVRAVLNQSMTVLEQNENVLKEIVKPYK